MNDLNLTKPHFSTKVYKSYIQYMETHFPNLDLIQICAEAGLSLDYLKDESNWVSVEFDAKFNRLCIEKTGDRKLSYRVGQQTLSEEVIGRTVYLLLKHSVSLQYIYDHLPQLTNLFSRVTRIELLESRKGFVHLRLSVVSEGLSVSERKAVSENIENIYENTLGHFTAIPTCQDMPPASIVSTCRQGPYGLPIYDMRVEFSVSNPLISTLAFVVVPILATVISYFAYKIGWLQTTHAFTLAGCTAIFGFGAFMLNGYLKLRAGFKQAIRSIQEIDARYEATQIAQELQSRQADSYGRFVPREFLKLLNHASITEVGLGDHIEAEMTILFADIRDFTSLSEKMTPEENFLFLNSYLRRISPSIQKHGGFIDKYIGDAIMAIFPKDPGQAVLAAIEMTKQVREYNEHRKHSGYEPIKIGIGINTGKMVMGTIGHNDQMQGTVISDCVNTASRLEKLTKKFGASIIVTQETLKRSGLSGAIAERTLGSFPLRGKKKEIQIHEIYEGEDTGVKTLYSSSKSAFEAAVTLYNKGHHDDSAIKFLEIIRLNPNDQAAQHYLWRIDQNGADLKKLVA